MPKGAPHLAKGGAALYESLIGANFADLHSLSFHLYNANRNTGYAPSLGQYWPYSGWNDRNAGITMAARRPRLCTACQSVPFIPCSRGSTDSRSLGEYKNEYDACTFNMRECASAIECNSDFRRKPWISQEIWFLIREWHSCTWCKMLKIYFFKS